VAAFVAKPAMVAAIRRGEAHAWFMHAARILELEQLLAVANDSLAKLTETNTELTRQVADAETLNRKLKRNARNDESSLRSQLATAQNRRL
jgi:cell division protein FtsB